MIKNPWVFDIEVFPNFFCSTFLNASNPEEIKSFTICWDLGIDDLEKMKTFLDLEFPHLISYNGLSYDANILDFTYNYSWFNIESSYRDW